MKDWKCNIRHALTALLTLAVAAMLVLCAWAVVSPEITPAAKDRHQKMVQEKKPVEITTGEESPEDPEEDDPWADMPW